MTAPRVSRLLGRRVAAMDASFPLSSETGSRTCEDHQVGILTRPPGAL